MKKGRISDVYISCIDGQKKYAGRAKGLLKTGNVLYRKSEDKKYVVKAFSCGIAVVREIR